MDFFQAQDNARQNTTRLVILFALAVLTLVVLTNLLVMAVLAVFSRHGAPMTSETFFATFDWKLFAMVGVGVTIVVIVGSLYKLLQLASGGKVVAESLGGRLVGLNTTDPMHRKILNVVEEMAIASGTPVPPVYVLEDEHGINAFAAGYTTGDAVIGVTRGCIELLNRDQLQGVIAHEFSHILNGDMRMNIRLIGILHGILVIGLIGYYLLRSSSYARSSRSGNSAGPILGLGLGLMVIGFTGTFFGNWIKASLSRQREYLADASAVQFTRNPDGIAGALKKIGGLSEGSIVDNPSAPEMSHAFFSNGVRSVMAFIFATHPPLEQRIRRIDRHWDGKFIVPKIETATSSEAETTGAAAPSPAAATGAIAAAVVLQAIDSIGRPSDTHLGYAVKILHEIPTGLIEAAREPYKARALIYSLVINTDHDVRDKQLAHLAQFADHGVHDETVALLPQVANLEKRFRLPLIDIAMGTLRQLSPAQYALFRKNLRALIEADNKIDLFEWVLQKIVHHHLDNEFEKRSPMGRTAKYAQLAQVRQECVVVLSLLAYSGHTSGLVTQQAFEAAAQQLGLPGLVIAPQSAINLNVLNTAIDKLAMLKPLVKPQFLKACAASITADGVVTATELELLRAIANAIDCPMPPLDVTAD
ncbi:MAG: M48 family metalloprotease [Gammaproteobacteria bacterium]|nr:M48 family metalloprotease [Gammaproteobacteria bacterium]